MRKQTLSSAVLLATVFMTSPLVAQETTLTAEARTALRYFFDTDCEIGDGGNALRNLLVFKEVLLPSLQAIAKDGPDKQALEGRRRELEEQWTKRQAYLEQNPEIGLSKEQLQTARQITKDDYINQGEAQFRARYSEKTAIALRAIQSQNEPKPASAKKGAKAK